MGNKKKSDVFDEDDILDTGDDKELESLEITLDDEDAEEGEDNEGKKPEEKKEGDEDSNDDQNEDGQEDQNDESDTEDEEDGEQDEDQRRHNKIGAQERIIAKLKKENEELKSKPLPKNTIVPPIVNNPPANNDPNDPRNWNKAQWDTLAEKDWQTAISLKARIEAEQYYNQSQQTQRDTQLMEESKRAAATRHPELNDMNSEKSKIFLQIVQENPRYVQDPKGPIHAMRDMEERMREMGYKDDEIVSAEKRGAKKEQERINRVKVQSSNGRTTPKTTNSVTLTPDEVAFCKHNEIDPKMYAKNKMKFSKTKKGEMQL
jgi:hypothetical protein